MDQIKILSLPLDNVNGLYPGASSSGAIRHSSVDVAHAALKAVHDPAFPRPVSCVLSLELPVSH